MRISEREKLIIEEFDLFDDWLDKYNLIIEMGKSAPKMNAKYKTSEYLIYGCTSQVWLRHELIDGKLYFYGDSDALIPKGIVAMIINIYSNSTPKEIIEFRPIFILRTGLHSHLSPNRASGLVSMIDRIKATAMKCM
jgi:cysteine desulfuration protein SufE